MQNQNSMKYSCSICLCTYQMGDSISICLESLLKNTLNNVEIVIVDDGSKDNTFIICRDYERKYKRIKYIKLKRSSNRMLGETRNLSVSAATSDIVLLHIDADDIWQEGIQDLINFYLYFRNNLKIKKMIIGNHIAFTSKDIFWTSNGYSNIYRGEDRDLMFRLAVNKSLYFLDHKIIYERQKRKKIITLIKSFKDLWSQSKYDVLNTHSVIKLFLSSLIFSPKNKTLTPLVKILRLFFIPICIFLFLRKRIKPIIEWDDFMIYRNKNRGEALDLLELAKSENLIESQRNFDYEELLSSDPFISYVKPEGFSLNQ